MAGESYGVWFDFFLILTCIVTDHFCVGPLYTLICFCSIRPKCLVGRGWFDTHQLNIRNDRLVLQDGIMAKTNSRLSVGNGMTDSFKMVLAYYDVECTPASIEPFVDISTCVAMKHTVGAPRSKQSQTLID